MVQLTAVQFDPFVAPPTTPIGTVQIRDRVAVSGRVTNTCRQWWDSGTAALHVTVTDDTGFIEVAFLGRTRVPGVESGRLITVAGAVIRRRGRAVIMNPYHWLGAEPLGSAAPGVHRALVTA